MIKIEFFPPGNIIKSSPFLMSNWQKWIISDGSQLQNHQYGTFCQFCTLNVHSCCFPYLAGHDDHSSSSNSSFIFKMWYLD